MELYNKWLCAFTLFYIHSLLLSSSGSTYGNETDRLSLLDFKARITHDTLGALSSWNNSHHFCRWTGVTCSARHGRVTILDLRSQGLVGTLSPHIGNLTFLRGINLRNNNFSGEIPPEIGRLFRLQHLNLTQNSLQGELPVNLSYCSELRFLDLVVNRLVGRIPTEIGFLSKLVGLGLSNNYLSGTIPMSISNLSFLVALSLSENSLRGNIPEGLGRLSNLKFFQVSTNELLTGTIPSQLFNISSIEYFGASRNQLHGSIPSYIGHTLPNLEVLLLGKNKFSGRVPESLSNSSSLQRLDLPLNYFSGPIPLNLGNSPSLTKLNVGRNQLGTGKPDDLNFLTSLANCSRLEILTFNNNNLGGQLPNSIANLSVKLSFLFMGANKISGSIPMEVENLVGLNALAMEENFLTGSIPDCIGKLPVLQSLSLSYNNFSGEIPSSIGNITILSELNLAGNNLHGSIPSSLGNCQKLQKLFLYQNKLNGVIPKAVVRLSSLSIGLDLAENLLTGNLPMEVGKLQNLQYLNLSENKLTGEIPSALGDCLVMEDLYLQGNFFGGTIPMILRNLKGLQELDLSRNTLSGHIPDFLETLVYLNSLNLSSNGLEGEVPKAGIFKNASAFSVSGNRKLCGGIPQLHLPTCSSQPSKGRRKRTLLKKVIFVVGGITCLVFLVYFMIYLFRSKVARRGPPSSTSLNSMFLKVSYEHLLKGTNGFSSENLIGVGSYGSVYKAVVEGRVVAVKVLDLSRHGASESFMAECEILSSIRHRNIVKILTSCSSIDSRGEEFMALVFEFMPNGNLDTWLHPRADEPHHSRHLSFMERINIAIDVANGLNYIHHLCHTPIVHCDLKPSNILLDDDMNGHVGDFGISRFLAGAMDGPENQRSSTRVKGTVGYVAPEYGIRSDVWTCGDVYSYGILLLEMFTGRRPTDDVFKDGLSLHSFVRMSLPDGLLKVIDPSLIQEIKEVQRMSDEFKTSFRCNTVESLSAIIKIGVSCSSESPMERMEMGRVVTELQNIKKRCKTNSAPLSLEIKQEI